MWQSTGNLQNKIKNSAFFPHLIPLPVLLFLYRLLLTLILFVCLSSLSPRVFPFLPPLLRRCLVSTWLLSSDFFSLGGVCQSWVCGSQNKQNSVFQWFWGTTDLLIVCACVCEWGFPLCVSSSSGVRRWLLFIITGSFQSSTLHMPTGPPAKLPPAERQEWQGGSLRKREAA